MEHHHFFNGKIHYFYWGYSQALPAKDLKDVIDEFCNVRADNPRFYAASVPLARTDGRPNFNHVNLAMGAYYWDNLNR